MSSVPGFFDIVWKLLFWVPVAWSFAVLVVAAVRGRLALVRDIIRAIVLSVAGAAGVAAIVTSDGPVFADLLFDVGGPPVFPPVLVAVATAVLSTASPHVGRPFRSFGHWLIGVQLVGAILLGAAVPSGALAAVALGLLAAWSPTGDVLAVTGREGDDEQIEILDTSGREVTVVRESAGSAIGSVAFTADGGLVTTRQPAGSAAGPVVIRNWRDGTVTQTIYTPAMSAVPSPVGDLVATVGDGREADIWDLATGQRLARLVGHTGRVIEVAFSTDGARVATASADGTVRLWDPLTGQQRLVLRGHAAVATLVSFSADGSKLASTSADGSVRISAIKLDDLITIAEGELTRSLTDEECQQYLHVDRCS